MPRRVPFLLVEGDVGLGNDRLQPVRLELMLTEGAREEPARIFPALNVDHERAF